MSNKILLISVVILLISSLSGCVEDTEKFIGSWQNPDSGNIIIFYSNGTCLMHRENMLENTNIVYGIQYLYEVSDGRLTINFDTLLYSENGSLAQNFTGGSHSYSYSFSQDQSSVELTEIGTDTSQLFQRTNVTIDQLRS